ncbi:MAG: OmpA family protein [Candidatus Dadabacteria bacterium]|nr:OmpA family protein [Candidatus Dadabacteria bacterium]NIS07261.1 OmpA family protein [Candidatus Dadabacteria bacterium]NIV40968.1 OmpA family protein [Candidatus Dadabacteria bacterium]NIY21199.1 OmpA family protein [Candidatus Dadabacteria bacterium]
MKNFQTKLLILVAFLSFGLLITSCAQKLEKEFTDAQTELDKFIEMGGDPDDIAEIEAMIDEARQLLDSGDRLGAQKLLEDARIRAIELQGEMMKANTTSGPPPVGGTEIEIGLDDVLFDYDQSRVRADAAPSLRRNAQIIKDNAARIEVVIVEGYCDTRGTDEYNLALGDKRAKSVMAYLVGIGVDPAMIEAVSKGETDEWGAGVTESDYQSNRRAHFKAIASGTLDNTMMESDNTMMEEVQ